MQRNRKQGAPRLSVLVWAWALVAASGATALQADDLLLPVSVHAGAPVGTRWSTLAGTDVYGTLPRPHQADRRASRHGADVVPLDRTRWRHSATTAGGQRLRLPGNRGIARMPGEFEQQGALLLASRTLSSELPALFSDVVGRLVERTRIVLMVNDELEEATARRVLEGCRIDTARVDFIAAPHDSIWVRDYGPLSVLDDGGRIRFVDSYYDEVDRPWDDDVPVAVARRWGTPLVRSRLTVDGGNLLSNGRGLMIATHALWMENQAAGWSEADVLERLAEVYGCRELVLLEQLAGEPNQHVDMFATFTSASTVVVGRYDPRVDAVNAAILDRNAERLSQVGTVEGPLRVVRIPMPPRRNEQWPTYTNVIYGNGVLLVPVYPARDRKGREKALATYRRLLPGWVVCPIDASALLDMQGGLHCMSMNLGPVGSLPPPAGPLAAEPPLPRPDVSIAEAWPIHSPPPGRVDTPAVARER